MSDVTVGKSLKTSEKQIRTYKDNVEPSKLIYALNTTVSIIYLMVKMMVAALNGRMITTQLDYYL